MNLHWRIVWRVRQTRSKLFDEFSLSLWMSPFTFSYFDIILDLITIKNMYFFDQNRSKIKMRTFRGWYQYQQLCLVFLFEFSFWLMPIFLKSIYPKQLRCALGKWLFGWYHYYVFHVLKKVYGFLGRENMTHIIWPKGWKFDISA